MVSIPVLGFQKVQKNKGDNAIKVWVIIYKTICKINVIILGEKRECCEPEIVEQIKKN